MAFIGAGAVGAATFSMAFFMAFIGAGAVGAAAFFMADGMQEGREVVTHD